MHRLIAFCVFVLAIGLPAVAADSPVPAAVTRPRVNLPFADFPSRFADGNCLQGLPKPVILQGQDKPAFCKSDKPLLFDMHHSPLPTKLILDASGGPGTGYDTLYVDFDDDGDFTNNPVHKATPFSGTMFPGAAPVVLYFRDVHLPRNLKQGKSARVQIYIEELPGWPREVTSLHPRIIPQRWAVGSVTVGGKDRPAAMIDRNWDETFVDKRGLDIREYNRVFPRGDYLLLGLDGESRLQPCDLDANRGSARLVLTEYVAIDTQVYQVQAEKLADGVNLSLVPVQPLMGVLHLDRDARAARLLLIGTSNCAVVHQPWRDIHLPADTYISPQMGGTLLTVRPDSPLPHQLAKAAATSQPASPGEGYSPAPSAASQGAASPR